MASWICTIILLILLAAHALIRPKMDWDSPNEQMIIHYWWFGKRKTFIVK